MTPAYAEMEKRMKNTRQWPVVIVVAACCMVSAPCADLLARDVPPPSITITEDEIADSPSAAPQGDYFTIGSQQEDVERIQGEPDDKFWDGRRMIWYYGEDAVYIDFYGRVDGVENSSGKLEFR